MPGRVVSIKAAHRLPSETAGPAKHAPATASFSNKRRIAKGHHDSNGERAAKLSGLGCRILTPSCTAGRAFKVLRKLDLAERRAVRG
jgi:hypothetical protein